MTELAAFEAMERDGWGRSDIATGYAEGFAHATAQVAEVLAGAVTLAPGEHVLDLCCGHGVVVGELLKREQKVTGLDFSPAMIELARAAVEGAQFVQGDAMAMAFEDSQFDAVTIGFGVPHFPDPLRGLQEAFRVTKSGGRVAFSIWEGKGSDGAFGWLFDAVAREGDPNVTLPKGPDAHWLSEPKAATDFLQKVGFTSAQTFKVRSQLAVSSPTDLFDVFDQGAVRAASLLSQQPEGRRAAIRSILAERAEREGQWIDGLLYVPAPSLVALGTKP